MAENEKRIVLAIDTGFDGGKICVNGHLINIPFMIQDISSSENAFELRRVDSSFVRCVKDGKTYLIGEVAKKYLLEEKKRTEHQADMETFYTMDRYKMEIFEVALDAVAAYGLYRYEELSAEDDSVETFRLEEISDWEIEVGVALPHQYLDSLIPVVQGYLSKPQDLKLMVGAEETCDIKYSIHGTFYNSQIVCALINEAVDDEGNNYDGDDSPYDNLPALILDGGYKTFGRFKFARDESITDDASNMDFAMNNINERVAGKINALTGRHYTGYMIESLVEDNESIRYVKEDGTIGSIDVYEEKKAALEETAKELIKHLNDTYDNLLDIKMILIAGGTGRAYYDYIVDYCKTDRKYLDGKVILAGSHGFMGKPCEPVYAVACGMYKDMIMQLNATE